MLLTVVLFLSFLFGGATTGSAGSEPDPKIVEANKTLLYDITQKAIADVVPKSAQRHLDEMAAFKLDNAGYSFEAKRWGDFLSIFMSRQGTKYATSLNLGKTTEITLLEGHPPDLNGSLSYQVTEVPDTTSKGNEWFTCYNVLYSNAMSYGGNQTANCAPDFEKGPGQGRHWAVSASLPPSRSDYPMISGERQQPQQQLVYTGTTSYAVNCNNNSGYQMTTTYVPYESHAASRIASNYDGPKVTNMAQDAEDDEISFAGLGLTLFAPAGRGKEVRDAILAAIDKGFVPPAPICKATQ
jgi:hypothetical protein